jgi:hypothetical protein
MNRKRPVAVNIEKGILDVPEPKALVEDRSVADFGEPHVNANGG